MTQDEDPYSLDALIGEKMSTVFLSDVHAGDVASKHKQLLEYLQSHQKEIDKIVVLGDLCDFWVAPLSVVLQEVSPLLEFLSKNYAGRFHFIAGNHDSEILYLKETFPFVHSSLKFPIGSKRAICLHGHELDNNKYEQTYTAHMVAWLINKFNGWGHMDLRKSALSFSSFIGSSYYNDLLKAYEDTLVTVFKDKYDYVITGHTHQPCIKTLGGITYINTGDSLQHSTLVLGNRDGFFLYDYAAQKTLDICRIQL